MASSQSCCHCVPIDDIIFSPHQLEGRFEGPCNNGASADIYSVRLNAVKPSRKVAIKFYREVSNDSSTTSMKDKIANELKIWKLLNHFTHPNVAPFLGVIHSCEETALNIRYVAPWPVSEYYENHDIKHFLDEQPVSAVERCNLLKGIISGLAHVHQQKVVHGDLRGANILVDDAGKVPKICDFGSSQIECACSSDMLDQVSTFQWQSPELRGKGLRTPKSDIWAFGCLALEVQFELLPYDADPLKTSQMIWGGLPPATRNLIEIDDPSSELIWGIIQACWSTECEERPNAESILNQLGAVSAKNA